MVAGVRTGVEFSN